VRNAEMSSPRKPILPALIACCPTMARISVVLPTPLRPITQVTRPGLALSETERRACAAP
jgi:hypothetical protein